MNHSEQEAELQAMQLVPSVREHSVDSTKHATIARQENTQLVPNAGKHATSRLG